MRGLRTIMLFVSIFIALLFDITHNSPHHEVQPAALEKQHAQKETSQAKSTTNQTTVPVSTETFDKQQPNAQSKPESTDDAIDRALYRSYLLATILGVGVALAGLWFLIRSAKAAEQAAGAAEKAAVAATKNTDSLKNAERANVDAELIQVDGTRCRINVTNFGKTPALISIYGFGHYWFPWDNRNSLPEEIRHTGNMCEERHHINQMLPLGHPALIREIDIAPYLKRQEAGKELVLFLVTIEYSDIFGDEHITEVAYSYSLPRSQLMNHPRYNR